MLINITTFDNDEYEFENVIEYDINSNHQFVYIKEQDDESKTGYTEHYISKEAIESLYITEPINDDNSKESIYLWY